MILGVYASLFLTGCGADTATVSGRVSFRKPPPTSETLSLTFVGPSGQPVTTAVAEDGSYTAHDVEIGTVRVAVGCIPAAFAEATEAHRTSSQSGSPVKPDRKPARKSTKLRELPPQLVQFPNPVPKAYWSPSTSRLTLTTAEGANLFDVFIEN